MVDDDFQIVQSRAITTLFPIPAVDDGRNHVYVSVGHQQMMTDPMKPLGLSFWQLTTPRPMAEAGGRLFVDVTQILATPASRASLLELMGKSDPLISDALQTILERDGFIRSHPDEGPAWTPPGGGPAPIETDPAIVTELIEHNQASIAVLKRDIQTLSGPPLLDFILADIPEMRRILFDPQSHQVFMSAMEATWWLNEQLESWLGEKNVADTLTRSVPHNVTSEMGLALLDVADVIRPHPEVVAFLRQVEDEGFLDDLATLAGGRDARDAICAYLDMYGMRCVGEIDITRPRWSERPTTLVPVILGNINHFEPGAGERRFEQGRQEALTKEREVLARLRALPDGEQKAEETKQMIDRVRTFIGYREYPKYGMVSRYFVYKQALLARPSAWCGPRCFVRRRTSSSSGSRSSATSCARTTWTTSSSNERKTRSGRIRRSPRPGCSRRTARPSPGRTGATTCRPVRWSACRCPPGPSRAGPRHPGHGGGRSRTGRHPRHRLHDPSWTPLFVAITGLVTEVGGLMTHGAVIDGSTACRPSWGWSMRPS